MNNHRRVDVLVVGARCAGASTAMLLARAGLEVLVVDQQRRGSDTLSTHALMRAAILQLERWGLLPAIVDSGAPAIRTTEFYYDDRCVAIDSPDAPLYSPRRTVLDQVLAEAAERTGARIEFGVRFEELLWSGSQVVGAVVHHKSGRREQIRASLVIGADGRQSRVAQGAQAPVYQRGSWASACQYRYYAGLGDRAQQWFYGNHTFAGIIPSNDDEACVFLCHEPGDTSASEAMDTVLTALPALASRLEHAEARSAWRRFSGARGFLRQPIGDGWALVGDAGYFKDPCTAHGISDAFRDAELLARAYLAEDLDLYQRVRDALSRELLSITDEIASCRWSVKEVQQLHIALSQEMKREVAYLELLGPAGAAGDQDLTGDAFSAALPSLM